MDNSYTPRYFTKLSDSERVVFEQSTFNFHLHFGRKMKIPPRMYEDFKRDGVRMDWCEPVASLEEWGNKRDM